MRCFAVFFGLSVVAVTGCGSDPANEASDEAEARIAPTFLCVSSVDDKALGRDVVFRAALRSSRGRWSASVQEGYLFESGTLHQHQGPFTSFHTTLAGGIGEGGYFFTSSRLHLNLPVTADANDVLRGKGTVDGHARDFVCFRPALPRTFAYDAFSGTCKDVHGKVGKNAVPLEVVRETKNGECTTIVGTLNDKDLGYPQLDRWNLAGADLSKATLFFAGLMDADLRGAKLAGFEFGYAHVQGTTDTFTVRPHTGSANDPSCKLTSNAINCWR